MISLLIFIPQYTHHHHASISFIKFYLSFIHNTMQSNTFTFCQTLIISAVTINLSSANFYTINDILFNWITSQLQLQTHNDQYYTVCHTDSCKQAGKLLLQGLNTHINPCDDFYEFACGRWAFSNPIPSQQFYWSSSKLSENNIHQRSLNILQSQLLLNASYSSKLLRQFFKHCMNSHSRESQGLLPIHNVTRIMGGWPQIPNFTLENEIKWQQIDQYYREITGSYSIIDIVVAPDYLNRLNNQINLSPAKFSRTEFFPLSERWKGWPKKNTPYTIFVKTVATIFLNDQHINFTKDHLDADIHDMLQFEYNLYKIQFQTTTNTYIATIKEVQQHYDEMEMLYHNQYIYNPTIKINWLKIIRQHFSSHNFTIHDNEKLYISAWQFLIQLPQLLNLTKNKAINNYIHWKFVMLMIPFTNDNMKELIHTGSGNIFFQTNESRQSDCLTEIRLTHALYREYAQKYFPNSEKIEMTNMAELIRKQVLHMIENSQWLDVKTRANVLHKIRNIHIMIGYPDWYDDDTINNYYDKLIPGQSHFQDTLNNIKFVNEKNLAEFRQPMDKYKWFLHPLTLNGIYKYYFNTLLITMAFAQSPIYSTQLPIAVKYGFLGSIIGHEIFHSLDPHGIEYDQNWKKLIPSATTIDKYKNKIDCIINQFNNYTFFERDPITNETVQIQVKGNLTKNEDMADIEGIRAAFFAYRANLKNNNMPLRLFGMEEFNSDQLFFISYANKWCHTAKTKWWNDNYGRYKYNSHSPSRYRVNRPMSNFPEFAQTFNCRIDNRMNPHSKCIVFNDP